MGHTIDFSQYDSVNGILKDKEISDIIELFFRWGDAKFRIITNEKERKFMGSHRMGWDGVHEIMICNKKIKIEFASKKRTGGNLVAPTVQCAAAMVLVHELQHANQTKLHKQNERFYTSRKYWDRACEREAREHVDNNMAEICAYFQAPWQGGRTPTMVSPKETIGEAQAVAELLLECSEVTMDDVRDELRASKILNPANVRLVIDFLKKNGVDII
jgi:hypothetical protein